MKLYAYSLLITLSLQFTSSVFAVQMAPIEARLEQTLAAHHKPVGIFDLDETLIHSTQRKLRSYQIAFEQNANEWTSTWPTETAQANQVFHSYGVELFTDLPNEYDSRALFAEMGITNADFITAVNSKMLAVYLNEGDLIDLDKPVQGAITFLERLRALGAKLFFVTSRYQDTQMEPTLENLITHRLFVSGLCALVMRDRTQSSLEFKTKAMDQIKQSLSQDEEVSLVAENEPENLNAMMNAFPEALPLFRDGAVVNTSAVLQSPERVIHLTQWVSE